MALTETQKMFCLNINRWGTGSLCGSSQWLSAISSTQILPVWEADLRCTDKEDCPHKWHPVWGGRPCSSWGQSDYNQSPEYPSTAAPDLPQLPHDEARVQTQGIYIVFTNTVQTHCLTTNSAVQLYLMRKCRCSHPKHEICFYFYKLMSRCKVKNSVKDKRWLQKQTEQRRAWRLQHHTVAAWEEEGGGVKGESPYGLRIYGEEVSCYSPACSVWPSAQKGLGQVCS